MESREGDTSTNVYITADFRIICNIDPFNQQNRIMALINIHICLFVIPSILIMSLRICSWNSRGVNAAKPYLQELMNENDIVVICEHQLYEAEMFKLNEICRDCDFSLYCNCSKHLVQHRVNNVPGNGGIAICSEAM